MQKYHEINTNKHKIENAQIYFGESRRGGRSRFMARVPLFFVELQQVLVQRKEALLSKQTNNKDRSGSSYK